MQNLGRKGRDKVTGFEGIITGKVKWLYGCDQYVIAPEATKDGKLGDSYWFDVGRIEIIGNGVIPEEVQAEKPGGDRLPSISNKLPKVAGRR
jgi:hypothetical protein